MNKVHIDHRFTSLNDWVYQNRAKKGWANKTKQDESFIAQLKFRGVKIKSPCKLIFTWHIPNKGNDLDNQGFAKKFIIDGMVKAKALENDNLNHVIALEDRYVKGKFGVTIEWEEIE